MNLAPNVGLLRISNALFPCDISLCGVIIFTYAAEFALRIFRPTLASKSIQQHPELDQVDRAEGSAAASNLPEFIRWFEVGQIRCDRAQLVVRTGIDNPVLTPMMLATDEVKLLTAQRMKRVRDTHFGAGRTHTTCN